MSHVTRLSILTLTLHFALSSEQDYVGTCDYESGEYPMPSPESCGNYLVCTAGGDIVIQSCPSGLWYNPVWDYCDYPENVDCYLEGTSTQNSACPCPNGAGDYSNPMDPTNSTFISCGDDCVWNVMPCPEGLVFYDELKMCWYSCNLDQEWICQEDYCDWTGENTPCYGPNMVSSSGDCSKFEYCYKHTNEWMICIQECQKDQNGHQMNFDEDLGICVEDPDGFLCSFSTSTTDYLETTIKSPPPSSSTTTTTATTATSASTSSTSSTTSSSSSSPSSSSTTTTSTSTSSTLLSSPTTSSPPAPASQTTTKTILTTTSSSITHSTGNTNIKLAILCSFGAGNYSNPFGTSNTYIECTECGSTYCGEIKTCTDPQYPEFNSILGRCFQKCRSDDVEMIEVNCVEAVLVDCEFQDGIWVCGSHYPWPYQQDCHYYEYCYAESNTLDQQRQYQLCRQPCPNDFVWLDEQFCCDPDGCCRDDGTACDLSTFGLALQAQLHQSQSWTKPFWKPHSGGVTCGGM